jgi:hypothetical protein
MTLYISIDRNRIIECKGCPDSPEKAIEFAAEELGLEGPIVWYNEEVGEWELESLLPPEVGGYQPHLVEFWHED